MISTTKKSFTIIFSNGLLDPWSGASVLTNISSTVIAVVIPEAAHHLDLRAANKDDPQSVIEARKFCESTFSKWISEFKASEMKHREKYRILKVENHHSNQQINEISMFLQEERKSTKSAKKTKPVVQRKYGNNVKKNSNLGMCHPKTILQAIYSSKISNYVNSSSKRSSS